MEPRGLITTIKKYSKNLSQNSQKAFAALCSEKKFASGCLLLEPHKYDQSEYLLLNGIARTFLLDTEGNQITLSFFEDNSVLPPYVTRNEKGKSLFYVETLTDCTFAKIDAKAFESLMIADLEIREFGNSVLRQELLNKVKKEIRMASWTAKARLQQFRKDFSMLENRLPHPIIASYLGITTVSLSRLRNQG